MARGKSGGYPADIKVIYSAGGDLFNQCPNANKMAASLDGVELIIEPAALREVACEAIKRKTGARALRAIIEQLMMDVMYEVPSNLDVKRVVLPAGCVTDGRHPILMTEDMIRQAS